MSKVMGETDFLRTQSRTTYPLMKSGKRQDPDRVSRRQIEEDIESYMEELASPEGQNQQGVHRDHANNNDNNNKQHRKPAADNISKQRSHPVTPSRAAYSSLEPRRQGERRRDMVMVMSAMADMEALREERSHLRAEVDELKHHTAQLKAERELVRERGRELELETQKLRERRRSRGAAEQQRAREATRDRERVREMRDMLAEVQEAVSGIKGSLRDLAWTVAELHSGQANIRAAITQQPQPAQDASPKADQNPLQEDICEMKEVQQKILNLLEPQVNSQMMKVLVSALAAAATASHSLEAPPAVTQQLPVSQDTNAAKEAPASTVIEYDVAITTMTSFGGGANARVGLEMHGEHVGWWAPSSMGRSMEHPASPLESGQTDTFEVSSQEDLGKIDRIRITYDGEGRGDGWQLARVRVTNRSSKETTDFPCEGLWMKKKVPTEFRCALPPPADRPASSSATSAPPPAPSLPAGVHYAVTFATGASLGSAADAVVSLHLLGSKDEGAQSEEEEQDEEGLWFEAGQLGKSMEHPEGAFKSNQSDTFVVVSPSNLGRLRKIRVVQHSKGMGGSDWQLAGVQVQAMATGEVYHFPCKVWLKKDEPLEVSLAAERGGEVESTIPAEQSERAGTTQYAVTFKTGSSMGAGTDAKVTMELQGSVHAAGEWWRPADLGSSLEHPANPFENRSSDTFHVTSPHDLGELQRIRVKHDGKGWGSDWQLDGVQVRNSRTGKIWDFACNHAWLKKNTPVEFALAAPASAANASSAPAQAPVAAEPPSRNSPAATSAPTNEKPPSPKQPEPLKALPASSGDKQPTPTTAPPNAARTSKPVVNAVKAGTSTTTPGNISGAKPDASAPSLHVAPPSPSGPPKTGSSSASSPRVPVSPTNNQQSLKSSVDKPPGSIPSASPRQTTKAPVKGTPVAVSKPMATTSKPATLNSKTEAGP